MAQAQTDKFMKGGISTLTTLAAPGKALAASSINVGSTTNWPTDTGKIIAIWTVELVDGEYEEVSGTYTEWSCTHSGTTVNNLTLEYGTDQVYAAGTTTKVAIVDSAKTWNRAMDGVLVEHNQNGTHAAVTATSVVSSGGVTGTTLTGTSLVNTGDAQLRSTSLETIRSETEFDYVASGGVWSGDSYGSTRNASMTAITVYIGGRRGTVSAVTARSFTASKDTYIDVNVTAGTFALVYTEVANNAASPALAANSIRIGIIVTGAGSIANVGSVNQGEENKVLPIASSVPYTVTDSLGNLICPRDPNRKVLGYRQVVANPTGVSSSSATQLVGLSTPVIIPSGSRKIKVTTYFGNVTASAGSVTYTYGLWSGTVGAGTNLANSSIGIHTGFAGIMGYVEANISPAAGSVTYNASLAVPSGTGTVQASATAPAFIKVELA